MTRYFLGGIVGVGLALSGFFIGKGLQNFRQPRSIIQVKGIGEKDVYADHVIWTIAFQTTGDQFIATQDSYGQSIETILAFLKEKNFATSEIKISAPNVERLLLESRDPASNTIQRDEQYRISGTVLVETDQVKKVEQAEKHTFQLLKKGVLLQHNPHIANPRYIIKNFDQLRPSIFAQALESSYKMALQVAQKSSANVGAIQSVDQGNFSIKSRVGYENEEAYPEKKVRVVSYISYALTS